MPWKEPGKGDKDPWKSGNDQPPDLDEVFKNVSGRIRSIFGGGKGSGSRTGGGSGGLFPLIISALVIWGLVDSIHILDEAEQGVVLRFGEYTRTTGPGLQFTFPRPIETLEKINVTRVNSTQDRGLMLTGDENLVNIGFEVQYQIADSFKYLFMVRDPEQTILEAAESAIREVVGTNQMDFILEVGRNQIAQDSNNLLQEILDRYETGMVVTQFNLPDVKPPPQVQDAFDDVVKAREDQERFVNEAQAYANKVVPEARGQAARILQEAEGYKQSTIALAEGEANRFSLLREEYEKAPEVTRQRLYLQTMEEVMSRSSKVMLDVNSSNNMLYLPLDQVQNRNPARLVPPVGNIIPTPSQEETSRGSRDGRTGRGNR